MKGYYVLIARLREAQEITVGRLGARPFPPGCYAYVGSALNGLEPRLHRHLRRNKRTHWHIDYLLQHGTITHIFLGERTGRGDGECALSRGFARQLRGIRGFGSSDCRCDSHLYFSEAPEPLLALTQQSFSEADLSPQTWFDGSRTTSTPGRCP